MSLLRIRLASQSAATFCWLRNTSYVAASCFCCSVSAVSVLLSMLWSWHNYNRHQSENSWNDHETTVHWTIMKRPFVGRSSNNRSGDDNETTVQWTISKRPFIGRSSNDRSGTIMKRPFSGRSANDRSLDDHQTTVQWTITK